MALGQKVPLLSEYLKLLPPSTQKEDIDNLRSALTRLPKRIVVLLDEIDRMERKN
jgi:Cdc6-like AAA superfamily ATPase